MCVYELRYRNTIHAVFRLLPLYLCTQLFKFCLFSHLEFLSNLLALTALLILEYIIGMKGAFWKLTKYLLFNLLDSLLALVLLRSEYLLHNFRILLLLSHHCIVYYFLLLSQFFLENLSSSFVGCITSSMLRLFATFFMWTFLIFVLLMIIMCRRKRFRNRLHFGVITQ